MSAASPRGRSVGYRGSLTGAGDSVIPNQRGDLDSIPDKRFAHRLRNLNRARIVAVNTESVYLKRNGFAAIGCHRMVACQLECLCRGPCRVRMYRAGEPPQAKRAVHLISTVTESFARKRHAQFE